MCIYRRYKTPDFATCYGKNEKSTIKHIERVIMISFSIQPSSLFTLNYTLCIFIDWTSLYSLLKFSIKLDKLKDIYIIMISTMNLFTTLLVYISWNIKTHSKIWTSNLLIEDKCLLMIWWREFWWICTCESGLYLKCIVSYLCNLKLFVLIHILLNYQYYLIYIYSFLSHE